MKSEYRAIVAGGFVLQLDAPDLTSPWHDDVRARANSEAERRVYQDRSNTTCNHRVVDNQHVIHPAGNAVCLPRPEVLERKAVLIDASQSGRKVGDNLLAADHQNDVTR